MNRSRATRWVSLGLLSGIALSTIHGSPVTAGPINSLGRYLGVGWSEGRHSYNRCPQAIHPSKPWSYPIMGMLSNDPRMLGHAPQGEAIPREVTESPLVPRHEPIPRGYAAPNTPTLAEPHDEDAVEHAAPVVPPDWKPSFTRPRTAPAQRESLPRESLRLDDPAEIEINEDPESSSPSDRNPDTRPAPPPPRAPNVRYPLETKSPRNLLRGWYPNGQMPR